MYHVKARDMKYDVIYYWDFDLAENDFNYEEAIEVSKCRYTTHKYKKHHIQI